MATAAAAAATALPDSEPPDTEGKAHLFFIIIYLVFKSIFITN